MVAIPYSSGHSFQLAESSYGYMLSTYVCRNPLFIRSFLPTRFEDVYDAANVSLVAIPYSSGHSFQRHPNEIITNDHYTSRNPLFIRSFLPTSNIVSFRRGGACVAIPYSSGLNSSPGRLDTVVISNDPTSQSLIHQVNHLYGITIDPWKYFKSVEPLELPAGVWAT